MDSGESAVLLLRVFSICPSVVTQEFTRRIFLSPFISLEQHRVERSYSAYIGL